jgi:hypothetical protein
MPPYAEEAAAAGTDVYADRGDAETTATAARKSTTGSQTSHVR